MSGSIELAGLTKYYGSLLALDGLTLRIQAGEVYGLLGPNGAGKTTCLGILAGLLLPSAGGAVIGGVPVRPGGPHRRRIGYLQQSPAFPSWMTGRELIEHAGEIYGLGRATRRRRAGELLDQMALTEAADRRIGGYSGGMRQRLGIASALVNDPDVLLLDEPVSGLDPMGRRELLEMIHGFAGRKTVVVSSHVLDDVDRVATSVGILDRGRLLVHAPITELRARYAKPVYELEFDTRPNGLAEELRRAPWAQAVHDGGRRLTVAVSDQAAAAGELQRLAATNSSILARFERKAPTLEEVFMQIVEEARR